MSLCFGTCVESARTLELLATRAMDHLNVARVQDGISWQIGFMFVIRNSYVSFSLLSSASCAERDVGSTNEWIGKSQNVCGTRNPMQSDCIVHAPPRDGEHGVRKLRTVADYPEPMSEAFVNRLIEPVLRPGLEGWGIDKRWLGCQTSEVRYCLLGNVMLCLRQVWAGLQIWPWKVHARIACYQV
jgi:hypothetical protein